MEIRPLSSRVRQLLHPENYDEQGKVKQNFGQSGDWMVGAHILKPARNVPHYEANHDHHHCGGKTNQMNTFKEMCVFY